MSLLPADYHLLNLKLRPYDYQGFLFGVKIPFLPDFLLDNTLLGKEPSDRIREYASRWTQFISGLWRSEGGITFALRFDLNQVTKE